MQIVNPKYIAWAKREYEEGTYTRMRIFLWRAYGYSWRDSIKMEREGTAEPPMEF